MDVTLYRYRTTGSKWDSISILDDEIIECAQTITEYPFQGDSHETEYGFAHCGVYEDVIYGLFVQKFPKKLTDYDGETKEEREKIEIDSGEYLFLFFPKTYEIYLQSKRSSELPKSDAIRSRFLFTLKQSLSKSKFFFNDMHETQDEVKRDRIVDIFYNEADVISELELEDFDEQLIIEQELARGKKQTYFNPIEEFQEAGKETAIRFAQNTKRVSMKAKPGKNYKKDVVARAALEGSRKPVKIVYKKGSETITTYGLTKSKEIISIEAEDFDLDNQISNILAKMSNNDYQKKQDDDSQSALF
jgi:hypothetical protein